MAKIDWDYARNADLWEHEQACEYVCPDPSDRARLDRLAKVAAHAKELFYVPIRRRRPLPDGYAYRPPEFVAFAQSKGFRPPPQLAGIASPRPAGWPWGEHETGLLRHLAAAAGRFWKNYDPSDPTTAPTNEEVERWLVKERGVPLRIAEVMATILRADDLPPGRRKK